MDIQQASLSIFGIPVTWEFKTSWCNIITMTVFSTKTLFFTHIKDILGNTTLFHLFSRYNISAMLTPDKQFQAQNKRKQQKAWYFLKKSIFVLWQKNWKDGVPLLLWDDRPDFSALPLS